MMEGVRGRLVLGTTAIFFVVTAALALRPVQQLDLALRDVADAHRSQLAYDIAVNVNRLGSGGWLALIALLIAAALAIRRRSWWPLAPVAAAFALTGASLTVLKWFFDRPPPHSALPDAVALFSEPGGLSYPSGHAVNAVVWYGVIFGLLSVGNRWLRIAPVALVGVVSIYLGFHWLTDVLAGICLGVIIDQVVRRVGPADRADQAPGLRPAAPQLPPR